MFMIKWIRFVVLNRKTSIVEYLVSLLKVRNFKLPRLILWLFPFVDSLAMRFLNLKPLRADKIGALNVRIRRYQGRFVRLQCGTEIKPGDLLIELHLNNAWFLRYKKTVGSFSSPAWAFASALAADLRYLARQMAIGGFFPKIKALCGVTLFHAAAPRFGFAVLEMPKGLWKSLNQFYLSSLRQTYYFSGTDRLVTGTKSLVPKEIWISRVKFLEKYGPKEAEYLSPKTYRY